MLHNLYEVGLKNSRNLFVDKNLPYQISDY